MRWGSYYCFGKQHASELHERRPLYEFLPGLHELAESPLPPYEHDNAYEHDDVRQIVIRWDQDVGDLFTDAHGAQVFTGRGDWGGLVTRVRVHLLNDDALIYRTLCFSLVPAPHWFVGAEGTYYRVGLNPPPSFCRIRWRSR